MASLGDMVIRVRCRVSMTGRAALWLMRSGVWLLRSGERLFNRFPPIRTRVPR